MLVLKATAPRNDSLMLLADPDAAVAYRSLEKVLSIASAPEAPRDVRPLVQTVLRSYLHALDDPRPPDHPIAWATFVRAATLLYFALNRHRELHADPRWHQAALTLQQITLENADLIVGSPRGDAS